MLVAGKMTESESAMEVIQIRSLYYGASKYYVIQQAVRPEDIQSGERTALISAGDKKQYLYLLVYPD